MTAKIVIMCETEKTFSVITANAPRLKRIDSFQLEINYWVLCAI